MSRKYRKLGTKGFSGGQQGQFQPMMVAAWLRCTDRHTLEGQRLCKGKRCKCSDCGYCAFYEAQLLAVTGYRSTTECDRKKDFENVMAHLEQLAGSGIKWTMKALNGDKTRVLWKLEELRNKAGFPEEYIVAIARTPFEKRGMAFPGLEALTAEDLVKLLGKVNRQALRNRKTETEADPF